MCTLEGLDSTFHQVHMLECQLLLAQSQFHKNKLLYYEVTFHSLLLHHWQDLPSYGKGLDLRVTVETDLIITYSHNTVILYIWGLL